MMYYSLSVVSDRTRNRSHIDIMYDVLVVIANGKRNRTAIQTSANITTQQIKIITHELIAMGWIDYIDHNEYLRMSTSKGRRRNSVPRVLFKVTNKGHEMISNWEKMRELIDFNKSDDSKVLTASK